MALKLTVHFNCSTKVAYVKDDSTYSLPASVKKYVLGSLNYPNGLSVFTPKNTILDPLINYNASPRVSANFTLGATIPAGNYTFSGKNAYEYINTGTNQSLLVTANNEFSILNANLTEALYVGGTITLAECAAPANDGTYTITAVDYNSIANSTSITVSVNTLQVDSDEDAVISFSSEVVIDSNVVYNYSTCASTLCPEISFTYDAFSTQYGSGTLTDNTNYTGWSDVSKTLSLYYPAGLSPAPATNPIETSTSYITINQLATGIYTCKLVATASYVQADGLVIDLTTTKIKQATVIAYTEMCGIQGCINKMLDRHVSYLKSAKISPLQQYVDQVYGLYINAKEALACGDKSTYSNYVSQIYTILGTTEDSCNSCSCNGSCDSCSDSCGCGQPDEPVWIDNLGINVDGLLEVFENFITNEWPEYQATVDALEATVTDVVLPAIEELENSVSAIGTQTTTNTGDISVIQEQVDNLDTQVALLEEQIATFSPSNSEVALNELFTNDGANEMLYIAIGGNAVSSLSYAVTISGNKTAFIETGNDVTFYSPADKAWYQGTVSASSYNSGTNVTTVTIESDSDVYWTTNASSLPLFLAEPSTVIYNFKKQFTLQNDNYWKLGDEDFKYWAKLKTSFLWNSTNVGTTSLKLDNEENSETIELRGINPGTMVDLELTFEKKFNGTEYDLVYMIDVKSSTSENKTVVEGDLINAGYTGYNPTENVDLYQNESRNNPISINMGAGIDGIYNITQDVYNTEGNLNSNRIISRYASGPSYPNNTSTQFFTGGNDVITFNSLNCNITILNFEVSFGKMPA